MKLRRICIAVAAVFTPAAHAQGFFLPANDAQLRDDLTLLADESVIRLPTSAWPMPVADVARAVGRVNVDALHEPALQLALLRVQARVAPRSDADEWRLRELRLTAGEDGLLRDYATLGRDNAELQVIGGANTDRWNVTLAATGVVSPQDDRNLRLDGSDVSIRWGNWLFSANQMDRWWGPGRDGSLILSTNARPMPGVSLDRIQSTPFDFPVLRWLGQWRFTGFLSAMESHRPDVNRPLFMGMRLSFKPAQIFEFGLSRTAQFCGEDRPCDAQTFWNVIAGRDNAGMRVSPEEEPGNQMAGFDARVVSPFRSLPVAVYAQLIGEDGSSTGIPERYLGLFGLEAWLLQDSGNLLRARVEYADTSCKYYSPGENPDCAYLQGIFTAGYRYRTRNIGHTTDSDSESLGLTLSLRRAGGDEWGLQWRRAVLDRYGLPELHNPLTAGLSKYQSGTLSWSGRLLGQDVSAQAGLERHERDGGARESGAFGFLQWRKAL